MRCLSLASIYATAASAMYEPFGSAGLASRIALIQGDITKLNVDAIVNAANRALLGGGGVDGAIHRAAGGELLKECKTLGGARTGEAKITAGYKLPAKHVIHTVGPNLRRMEAKPLLKDAYANSLTVAMENNLTSIAFPCISTGVFGYPPEEAAHVALEATKKALLDSPQLSLVIFCVFLNNDKAIYEKIIPQYFSNDEL